MTETVARGTLQRSGTRWLAPELGGELAWNRLDSRYRADAEAQRREVSEWRGDLFANAAVTLSPRLRLESGLAVEASRIAVEGAEVPARTLAYWKPSAALVWQLRPTTQLRLDARRTVGQLDFEAFADSGDLINNRPISGNAELRPEVIDTASLSLDHRFGVGGALSVAVARERIGHALAYVPLDQGGQALANAGHVDLWRVTAKATLPLDRFVDGARLTVEGEWVESDRRDPLTGARADARDEDEIEIAWRQDLPRWRAAYGVSVAFDSAAREWYVDELQSERIRPYVTAYVETMLPGEVKATLTGYGVTGELWRRGRTYFTPDRAGVVSGAEQRDRRRGAYVNLLLSRQF